jgi:hypothetical protein
MCENFIINKVNQIAYYLENLTMVPVEAIESKPTKAKKHLAAPAITPENP